MRKMLCSSVKHRIALLALSESRPLFILVVTMLLIMGYGTDDVQLTAWPPGRKQNYVKNIIGYTATKGKHCLAQIINSTASRPKSGDNELLGRWAVNFTNIRKSRLFSLFGTNFSLTYNLTISGSNTLGNITVTAAPAATTYYYAQAPYYPYGYGYNPYSYYNPYGYGYYYPYTFNYYG